MEWRWCLVHIFKQKTSKFGATWIWICIGKESHCMFFISEDEFAAKYPWWKKLPSSNKDIAGQQPCNLCQHSSYQICVFGKDESTISEIQSVATWLLNVGSVFSCFPPPSQREAWPIINLQWESQNLCSQTQRDWALQILPLLGDCLTLKCTKLYIRSASYTYDMLCVIHYATLHLMHYISLYWFDFTV